MSEETIRVKRTGHDPVDMLPTQVSTTSLARIFSLDPATVWVREEFGSRIFFPDTDNTSFDLPSGINRLVVEGAPVVQGPSHVSGGVHVATPVTSAFTGSSRPIFHSGQKKAQGTFNIKVVQASLKWLSNGKPEFKHLGQLFVDITEATANVHYIEGVVQKKWGADHIIVTADGLQLDDSPGTQGFKFWKAGNRKIFAVPQYKGKGKTRRQVCLSDDDDDFEPPSKRYSSDSKAILKEIHGIKEQLASYFQLSANMKTKIPPGLLKQLHETFKCHICSNTPMKPPIIFARCCKRILGCQTCVDRWYRQDGDESNTRSCPLCRGERAYAETSIIKGLDDFLLSIAPMLSDEGKDEVSSEDEFPAVIL